VDKSHRDRHNDEMHFGGRAMHALRKRAEVVGGGQDASEDSFGAGDAATEVAWVVPGALGLVTLGLAS
jgi:hypothetical protein